MFEKLSAPFPPEAIHWRAQTLTNDGSKALALAYLDARDVMDRLDEVCGPAGWQSSITETPSGRVLCKLELWDGERWIAKTDGAGSTAVEGEKGGISDALKRAAVLWGIGRYLYDLGNVWAPCESKEFNKKQQWKAWKPEAQQMFTRALAAVSNNTPSAPTYITDAQRDEIALMAQGAGVDLARICGAAGVQSLKELPATKFEAIINRLKATMASNAKQKEPA